MADEQAAAGPPPGSPGQRALGAMESAVRRARESTGIAPPPDPTPTRGQVATPADPTAPVAAVLPGAPGGRPPSPGRERWLTRSVAAVAALVAAAAIALLVSVIAGPSAPAPNATRSAPTTAAPTGSHSTGPRSGGRGRTAGTTSPSSSSTTSTSTTVAVAPNGPPVISSLSPSNGSAGQSITIAGANFLSTDGHIVATFNGQVAPTSCPAQNTCTVTVPASTTPSAQVVITTAGGASNAVTFSYD